MATSETPYFLANCRIGSDHTSFANVSQSQIRAGLGGEDSSPPNLNWLRLSPHLFGIGYGLSAPAYLGETQQFLAIVFVAGNRGRESRWANLGADPFRILGTVRHGFHGAVNGTGVGEKQIAIILGHPVGHPLTRPATLNL